MKIIAPMSTIMMASDNVKLLEQAGHTRCVGCGLPGTAMCSSCFKKKVEASTVWDTWYDNMRKKGKR